MVKTSTLWFEERICNLFPVKSWEKFRVCLAISGGSDSVALLRAMANIAERNDLLRNLVVITVNHGLRGKESDEEALFVKELAHKLNLPAYILNVDPLILKTELHRTKSLESAARNARYQLLVETAEHLGARYVATAHQRDDQLETILFRLMRGAGFKGVCGMEIFRPLSEVVVLARPMLAVTRSDVLEYLNKLHQDYKTDSSNFSAEFIRNRLRNELVPTLNSIFPDQWQRALLRHIALCKSMHEKIEQEVDELEKMLERDALRTSFFQRTLRLMGASDTPKAHGASKERQDSIVFPLAILQQASECILSEFFRRIWNRQKWSVVSMGDNEWRRLAKSVKIGVATNQFPDNIVLTFEDSCTVKLTRKR